jgi:chemotaxis response regulator CheB
VVAAWIGTSAVAGSSCAQGGSEHAGPITSGGRFGHRDAHDAARIWRAHATEVVVGGSAGSIAALRPALAKMPPDLAAAIGVVGHARRRMAP